MCGRYAFVPTPKINERFGLLDTGVKLEKNYNVSPGMSMPVIASQKPQEFTLMKWGFVPYWAQDPKIGYKMINARAETLAQKPSFRNSLLTKRCLIPASGFYEWQKLPKGKKPFYITLKNQDLFAFAGLYDIWKDNTGKELQTYTIITTTPNEIVAPIHDRMPVILEKKFEKHWLDLKEQNVEQLLNILKPFNSSQTEAKLISNKINDPQNNFPTLFNI